MTIQKKTVLTIKMAHTRIMAESLENVERIIMHSPGSVEGIDKELQLILGTWL